MSWLFFFRRYEQESTTWTVITIHLLALIGTLVKYSSYACLLLHSSVECWRVHMFVSNAQSDRYRDFHPIRLCVCLQRSQSVEPCISSKLANTAKSDRRQSWRTGEPGIQQLRKVSSELRISCKLIYANKVISSYSDTGSSINWRLLQCKIFHRARKIN